MTDDDHINAVVLIAEAVEFGNNNVSDAEIVINYRAIDYCFANIGVFVEYRKFIILLIKRKAEKEISFMIAGQKTVKIMIEIKDKKESTLHFKNVLHTLGLYSNLISILKTCNLGLGVHVEMVKEPCTFIVQLVSKATTLGDYYCHFGHLRVELLRNLYKKRFVSGLDIVEDL